VSRKPIPSNGKSDKKGEGVDPALVRELAAILRDTDLTEIEVEHGALKIRVSRAAPAAPAAPAPAPAAHPVVAPTTHAHAPAPAAESTGPRAGAVNSPMVGTAYLSPEPGAPAFVKIGDTVAEGQTVLVVEAMKTFNPIHAPRAGKVVEILVADAQPVEFGEPLLILE
jgi:acetyl-CoA carboxylase biotin carboxyl carrier protein